MLLLSRTFLAGIVLAIAPLATPGKAYAQPQQVEVDADQDWSHKWTGLTIPPRFEGFVRDQVTQYVPDELNVSVQLFDEDRETSVTVYIYRTAAPNVSIWSDRAVAALIAKPKLGTPIEGQFFKGRFTPLNNSGTDSGFHAVTPLEGADLKATGVSLFAHDDWIIKIRASSSKLGDTEITQLIGAMISGFDLGASEATYPPVKFIEPCEKDLKLATKLKLQRFDLMGQIIFAPITEEISVARMGSDAAEKSWCRDRQSSTQVGIYRSGSGKDSYFAALGDSGVGAYVAKFGGAGGLLKARGYLVKISDGAEERTWPLFDKMPHPFVIAENYSSISAISKSDIRPGGEGGTTILVSPDSIPD